MVKKKKLIRVMGTSSSMDSQLRGQLMYLDKYFDVLAISSGQIHLDKIAQREQIEVLNIDMVRGISPLKDFISLYKLIKLFKKTRPIIVHGSSPKGAMLSMLASYICRVPHRIYTVTGLRFETTKGFLRKLLITIEKLNCYCATKVIPEGKGVRKTLIEENITNKSLKIILNGNINGVNLDYYSCSAVSKTRSEIRAELGIAIDELCFIYIGRIVKDKGINELIIAFLNVSKCFDCKLLLLGDIEDINPIETHIKEEILSNKRILFKGYQEDIRPFLKAADIFVFPSYREGFPNVVLQACAMELPSIVTDISGCNEIIHQNTTGYIIKPQNSSVLETAMFEVGRLWLEKKECLIDMGRKARIDMKKRFEQQKVWDAILDTYNKL